MACIGNKFLHQLVLQVGCNSAHDKVSAYSAVKRKTHAPWADYHAAQDSHGLGIHLSTGQGGGQLATPAGRRAQHISLWQQRLNAGQWLPCRGLQTGFAALAPVS
jgi:hypothetical protein